MDVLNQWESGFRRIYDRCRENYEHGGARTPDEIMSDENAAWLRSQGIKRINLFDYIEDLAKYGEPDYGTALLLASARRDYFLFRQGARWIEPTTTMDGLPAKTDRLDGIEWLPRIIPKARGFLEGSLEDDLMYGCGGDRNFLKTHALNPVDFLHVVDRAGGDTAPILEYVRNGGF